MSVDLVEYVCRAAASGHACHLIIVHVIMVQNVI